jgi:hypothetical protein
VTYEDALWVQRSLIDTFEEHPPQDVAIGLFRRGDEWGVAIRSQDPFVDAVNLGEVVAR